MEGDVDMDDADELDGDRWSSYKTAVDQGMDEWDVSSETLGSPFYRTYPQSDDICRLILQGLYGNNAPLWEMLLYLTGIARVGARYGVITGPVGAGKTTAILAFFAMAKCFTECTRVAVLCQCNDPLDEFTQRAF